MDQRNVPRAPSPLNPNYNDTTNQQQQGILAPDWRRQVKVRLRYYIPILKWLPEVTWNSLAKDVLSGMTCAMLILPAALSYSTTIVKVPPIYGLYTSIFPALIYTLFGTSRQLSMGPEAVVSLLTGSAISEYLATTDANDILLERIQVAASLSMLIGLITLLLGIFRVGFLDNVLSRPLLRGFITAVACVIVVEQLGSMVFGKGYHFEYPDPPTSTSIVSTTSSWETITTSWQTTDFTTTTLVEPTQIDWKRSQEPVIPTSIPYESSYTTTTSSIKIPSTTTLTTTTSSVEPTPEPPLREHPPELTPLQKLISTIHQIPGHAHLPTCLISLFTMITLVFAKSIKSFARKKDMSWVENIPEILIIMILSIIVSQLAHFDQKGVRVLGKAAKGNHRLPPPSWPLLNIEITRQLFLPASLIAVIGFVESNAVTKTLAAKHDYAVSPNRELVALGTSNIFGSIFGCWPAFGSLARSIIVDKTGGQTQIMGVVSSLMVLIVAIWLLPLLSPLPIPVLASVISVAAMSLIEWHDVHYMLKLRAWKELSMMLLSFVVTFVLGIEVGTLISIGVSLIMVIRETTRVKVEVLGMIDERVEVSSRRRFKSLAPSPTMSPSHSPVRSIEGILILRVQESMLFFGNTAQLRERIRRLEMFGREGVHPGEDVGTMYQTDVVDVMSTDVKAVILDWSSVNVMDASALQILHEIVDGYQKRGILICFVNVMTELLDKFQEIGMGDVVEKSGGFFDGIREAVTYCQENMGRIVDEPVEIQVDSSPIWQSWFGRRRGGGGGGGEDGEEVEGLLNQEETV